MKWYRVVIVLMVAFILTANGQDSEEEENEREPETGLDRPFEENNATILVEDQTWEQLYAEMASTNYSSFEARDDEVLVTHVVYFDITIGDGAPSRVTFGLFGANVPQTVANFRALVHGEDVYVPEVEETRHFGYAGTTFRRLTPWYLQAGSFDTGVHRYGAPLADNIGWKNESFDVPHVGRGWLSMASVGDHFGSQFIVALQKNSWLNGKDVVFGKVLSGIQVIDQIAALPVNSRYYSDVSVTITNCGEIRTEPFMTIKEGVFDFDSYNVADNRLLVTHKVYLNITFGGYPAEPIVIGLFGNTVPRTVENFIGLARGQMKYVEEIGEYKYYGYKGSSFHRIKYSFAQGGGFDVGRDFPGGGPFIDDISSWKNENFDIDHNGAGWVSMANVGSRFGSQFCIAFRNNSFLNGADVVFGKILTGMDSAVRMRDTPVDDDYHPYETEIRITDSGIIPTEPFTVSLGERRPENKDSKVTQLAYFDITMGGVYTGRILFGLFRELTPITTLNFANLCTGAPGYGFVNSTFFRVIDGFMLQGGYNGRYGSSFGGSFNDENFVIKNRGAGWLGMANAGKNTNGGQIYITTVWTQWLDNKHVIFAKVLSGMDVAHQIEQTEVDPSDRHRPLSPVVITDCQLIDLPEEKHFVVDKEPLNCEL